MSATYRIKDLLSDIFTLLKQPRFIRLCLLIRMKYRLLYKKKIRFPLRPLWVPPEMISTVVTGDVFPTSALVHPDRLIAGDWDINRREVKEAAAGDLRALQSGYIDIAETDIHQAITDHFLHLVPWKDTAFFERVMTQINSGKRKWRCQSEEHLLQRLTKLDTLYAQMEQDGYKSQRDMRTFRCWDEIRVAIGRDGRFHLFDGRHRLSLAKILGVKKVPVLVNFRHPSWEGDLSSLQILYEKP